ncbi:MAG: CocE/NonD family hydrolase [Gemmatimonadetes bacterium]|nr:CocE/NonD family hydrolase [Gemmatimonadota bacterium]
MPRIPVGVARLVFAALLAVTAAGSARAQAPSVGDTVPNAAWFDRREVMIPMRDGVSLHTLIYTPKANTTDLPFILTRTPYGIAGAGGSFATSYAELAREGYIFVYQDNRGRFTSEGQFVMLRPPRDKSDPKAVDEASDTWDTIEWLLKNVPHNNGRVGQLGVSYPGWLTVMSMLDPHPALKAVSPQASPASMFLGDDFHHNGAFRLSYGFEYVAMMEASKTITPFAFDQYDSYKWFLDLGPLSNVPAKLNGSLPTWGNFASHPNFDAFWQREWVTKYLTRVTVPTLSVAGWWDQEDFYGAVTIYEALERFDTNHQNYLVVGPWNHGGWRGASGQKLGPIDFGAPTAREYRSRIEAPWFAYWLKGKGELHLAEATVFEAGANAWRSYESWPLKAGVTQRKLYFGPAGALSFNAPAASATAAYDEYISDPAAPVPYRARPIVASLGGRGSTWSTWLSDDQRFVQDRVDVAAWETPVLTEDVTLGGSIAAHLFASTTGSDADWVVKLIDVLPEGNAADPKMGGFQFMVANDVFRGRFRESFEKPKALVPGAVNEFTIDLHTQAYRFLKGHRIRVQVQSSWFPLIDRNPQRFVPNIFEAKPTDFIRATQRIWRAPGRSSYVEFPVVSNRTGATP